MWCKVGDTTGEDNEHDKEEIIEDAKDHDCPDTVTNISDERKESSSTNSFESTEIAPEVRKRLETKWEKILGPKYKIIVSKNTQDWSLW